MHFILINGRSIGTVSYTHLDVYKRQLHSLIDEPKVTVYRSPPLYNKSFQSAIHKKSPMLPSNALSLSNKRIQLY